MARVEQVTTTGHASGFGSLFHVAAPLGVQRGRQRVAQPPTPSGGSDTGRPRRWPACRPRRGQCQSVRCRASSRRRRPGSVVVSVSVCAVMLRSLRCRCWPPRSEASGVDDVRGDAAHLGRQFSRRGVAERAEQRLLSRRPWGGAAPETDLSRAARGERRGDRPRTGAVQPFV
jgi:hypothetical protein